MNNNRICLGVLFFLLLASASSFADELPIYQVGADNKARPATLGYEVSEEFDANNCEFYVNSFGKGSFSHTGATQKWYEAWISVDEQCDVVNVGVYIKAKRADSMAAFYLASQVEAAYYRLHLTYYHMVPTSFHDENFELQVQELAFFADVKRRDGRISRLWLKNGEINFTLAAIFGEPHAYPLNGKEMGVGGVGYVSDQSESPIYNQKKACAMNFEMAGAQ